MLVLALVPALTVTPANLSGQGYATITTQTTATAVSKSYTTFATSVMTNKTVFTSYNYPQPTVSVHLGAGAGWESELNFVANKGDTVYTTLTSSVPIIFMVLADANHARWLAAKQPCYCDDPQMLKTFGPLVLKFRVVSSVDKFVIPSDGTYWFMFFNLRDDASGSVDLEATSSYTIITTAASAISSITELRTLTTTTAIAQVGLPFGNLALLGAIVAVAVVAGVLVVTRRRKPSLAAMTRQEEKTRVYDTTAQESTIDSVASEPVTPTKPTPPQPVISRPPPTISTGYVDLDRALEGGIPEKFSVVIVSPSFDERDLLLRKLVESALSSGRLVLLVSNDLGRTEDMAGRYPNGFYALSPQADRISPHGPNLLKIPSFDNLSDANISLGLALKDIMTKEEAQKRIMIVDVLSDLLLRHKSVVTRRWLTDFVGKRKAEGFTVIATLNPLTTTKEETQSIIDFFDGVIEIFEKPLMERTRRFLIVKKMYGQRHSDSEVLIDRDKLF
jgi:KaiC/GvpD/RAD55 family RecA-like ATPase